MQICDDTGEVREQQSKLNEDHIRNSKIATLHYMVLALLSPVSALRNLFSLG